MFYCLAAAATHTPISPGFVRFILRMELNANPLASEFDPFGRIILMLRCSPSPSSQFAFSLLVWNLFARFATAHTSHNSPEHRKMDSWGLVRVGCKSRGINQKSLHQKLCNQSARRSALVSVLTSRGEQSNRIESFHNQSQRRFSLRRFSGVSIRI